MFCSHLVRLTMLLLAMLLPFAHGAYPAKENSTAISSGQAHQSFITAFQPPPSAQTTGLHSGLRTRFISRSSAYVTTSSAVPTPSNVHVPPINAPSNEIALTAVVVSALALGVLLLSLILSNRKTKKQPDDTETGTASLRKKPPH